MASLLAVLACNKEAVDSNVAITTHEVTEITDNSAKSGGEIISDGGAAVRVRGVCWGIEANPTIAGSKTEDGKGTGTFSSSLSGLKSGQTYHVRAYAVNANGTFYGNELVFSVGKALPVLSTSVMSEVTFVSAKTGGVITSAGGDEITACGVCWGEEHNPDISGKKTVDVPGEDGKTFVSEITGLEQDKVYYVRAYATNSVGTAYGDEIRFSTSSEPVVEFADEKLAAFIIGEYDLNNDGKLQESEAAKIQNLDCSGKGIKSLSGIENLTELKELRATANELTSIDLSANSKLEVLWAFDNPALSSVNLSELEILKYVHVYRTALSSIDVKGLPSLTELILYDNPDLTSVDVTHNNQLAQLSLIRTGVTSVNLENKSSLQLFWADGSPLSSLNVKGCTGLKELYVQQTRLSNLDVSGLTSLEILSAFDWEHESESASINADGCTSLRECLVYNSGLTSLSMKNCPSMKIFRGWKNNLTEASFAGMPELVEFNLDANKSLTSLEFGAAQNPKLEYINIHGNQLTSLDCSNMTSLKFVHCGDSNISSMNFSGCNGLLEAYLFNNPGLSSLDFKDSPNLSILWAFKCPNLSSVNVEPCSKLTYIACDQSGLTEIKLTDKPLLTDIVMWGNRKMTKAVCSNLPECKRINFEQCEPLSDVTFTNIPAVEWFNIIVTSVKSLDFSGMTKLNWLAVRDIPTLEKLKLDNTPSLVNLYGWNTSLTTLDLRGCSKNMNEVFLDANPKLTAIYVASDQQIANLHRDDSCEIK